MNPSLRLTDETGLEANGQAAPVPIPAPAAPWLLTLDDLAGLIQRSRRSLESDCSARFCFLPLACF